MVQPRRAWILAGLLAPAAAAGAGVYLALRLEGPGEPGAASAGPASKQDAKLLEALVRAALVPGREEDVSEALRSCELLGGPEGVRGLYTLARAHREARPEAAVRLSRIASREAAAALAEVISNELGRGPLAAGATRALGRSRVRAHVPLLVSLAGQESDEQVRLAALAAFGDLPDPDALSALEAALSDSSSRVRRQALRSLASYRGTRPVRIVESFLERSGPDAPTAFEAEIARETLGTLKGEPVRPPR